MTDENLIRPALDTWQRAFCRKDADTLMALYVPKAVCYDAIPPFFDNPESMRRKVLECFPYYPEGFAIETRDSRLNLGGEVVKPKFAIGQYGHVALARDSEGNMIGLHSMQ